MNEELRLHIKKMQVKAIISLISVLLTIIFFVLALIYLFISSLISVVFFAVAVFSVAYLICSSRISKKKEKETVYKPVVFNRDSNIHFEKTVGIFENLTDKENQLSASDDVRFFRFNKIFKLRAVLYRTENFDKKEFAAAKDRINKKANKELNITHSISKWEAVKTMRFNIVCTDKMNDELYRFLSQNAKHNMTRVEGVINIAVVDNQVIIPPLYGDCDLAEISRYKGVIRFITEVLL